MRALRVLRTAARITQTADYLHGLVCVCGADRLGIADAGLVRIGGRLTNRSSFADWIFETGSTVRKPMLKVGRQSFVTKP